MTARQAEHTNNLTQRRSSAFKALSLDSARLDALEVWAREDNQVVAERLYTSIVGGMTLREAIDAAIAAVEKTEEEV